MSQVRVVWPTAISASGTSKVKRSPSHSTVAAAALLLRRSTASATYSSTGAFGAMSRPCTTIRSQRSSNEESSAWWRGPRTFSIERPSTERTGRKTAPLVGDGEVDRVGPSDDSTGADAIFARSSRPSLSVTTTSMRHIPDESTGPRVPVSDGSSWRSGAVAVRRRLPSLCGSCSSSTWTTLRPRDISRWAAPTAPGRRGNVTAKLRVRPPETEKCTALSSGRGLTPSMAGTVCICSTRRRIRTAARRARLAAPTA